LRKKAVAQITSNMVEHLEGDNNFQSSSEQHGMHAHTYGIVVTNDVKVESFITHFCNDSRDNSQNTGSLVIQTPDGNANPTKFD
jgi:UDP-galactopyranose mutase